MASPKTRVRPGMSRLDTWIPDELMKRLRVKAALESKTLGQVVAEILNGSLR